MDEGDFDKEYVKQQIEDIYGSIVAFSEELGVTSQTIHNKLAKPSDKFIRQTEKYYAIADTQRIGHEAERVFSKTKPKLLKIINQSD